MDTEGTPTRAGPTPGPWLVDESDIGTWVIASDEGGTFICRFNNCRRELYTNAEANARLIAAAPDLLAALELLFVYATADAVHPDDEEGFDAAMADAAAAIRKAKAEGGAS